MKRKAEPASLEEEEEDPRTRDILRKAAASASITSSSDQFERRRQWRKSDLDFQSGSASKYLGPMLEILGQAKEEQLLTILAGEHDDNLEVWQECEKLGPKYRAFYHVDKVINGESKTYVEREILISKENGDLDRADQEIIIAQRTYSTRDNIELKAHLICFQGRLDLNRPYIFPRLGDEIPGVGFPDLHCMFRGIRDWDAVARGARFASYDRNISIEITRDDIQSGRETVFDYDGDKILGAYEKSRFGFQISCDGFHDLVEAKKQKMGGTTPTRRTNREKLSTTIAMKLLGMGPIVEGTLRADININLVLKD